MQTLVVTLVYGFSFVLAVALLYFFEARWFWHVLSLAAALAVGLAPLPPELHIPDLAVGAVFLLLFVWGAGVVLLRTHSPRHRLHLAHRA
jgi:hypothetical protein